mmetsp:Transcript_7123/g.17364  ORF Transcript_7123/g.17364 Transcript_7123/m.17364 type:complete len:328 (+) Transcript_7123:1104-2087(+)
MLRRCFLFLGARLSSHTDQFRFEGDGPAQLDGVDGHDQEDIEKDQNIPKPVVPQPVVRSDPEKNCVRCHKQWLREPDREGQDGITPGRINGIVLGASPDGNVAGAALVIGKGRRAAPEVLQLVITRHNIALGGPQLLATALGDPRSVGADFWGSTVPGGGQIRRNGLGKAMARRVVRLQYLGVVGVNGSPHHHVGDGRQPLHELLLGLEAELVLGGAGHLYGQGKGCGCSRVAVRRGCRRLFLAQVQIPAGPAVRVRGRSPDAATALPRNRDARLVHNCLCGVDPGLGGAVALRQSGVGDRVARIEFAGAVLKIQPLVGGSIYLAFL